MSANSGFAVISALPLFTPVDPEQPTVDELKEYRSRLEEEWISAIRSGLFAFSMPKESSIALMHQKGGSESRHTER